MPWHGTGSAIVLATGWNGVTLHPCSRRRRRRRRADLDRRENVLTTIPARCAIGLAAIVGVCGSAAAELPVSYTYQIQLRSNFASNPGGSFNIPGSWFHNSNDAPALNNSNQVANRISVTSGDFHALWFGGGGVGGVVHQGPTGSFFSAASLNDTAQAVFEQQFTAANGIYRYQNSSGMTAIFTNRPLGASGWSSPQINAAGQVGYRASFTGTGNAFISSQGEAFPPFHAAEVGVDSMSPYSFIFTPSFNNQRRIAAFVRLGGPGQTGSAQPDEIRVFAADGTSTLIARDRNADPLSNFRSFDNAVDLNNNGWVAFSATLEVPSGVRGVFLSDGAQTITIARTDGGVITNLEFFAPALNDSNLVAFRAFDTANKRAVWVGDGTGLVRVATEEQLITTDLGQGRIDQNDSSPVFGGGPSINNLSNVAFHAALTPPDNNQIEWGTGLFVALAQFPPPPPCPGDADGDGDRDFADITKVLEFFGATCAGALFDADCPGDADDNNIVNFADITKILEFFSVPCPN